VENTKIVGIRPAKGYLNSVSSYNRTPKRIENVRRENIDDVLHSSDVVLLHLAYNEETAGFLSKEKIARIKNGAIVINMADKRLVSEKYMAEALKSGTIDQYAYETESTHKSPLEGIETALAYKPFGGYTREALNRNREVWVRNIEDLSRGKPTNMVIL